MHRVFYAAQVSFSCCLVKAINEITVLQCGVIVSGTLAFWKKQCFGMLVPPE